MTSPRHFARPVQSTPGLSQRPFVIAHRGASARAPENTLAAFEMAWRAGADAIELDVQRTLDGTLVVLHDPTLDRATNATGRVDRTPAAGVLAARVRFDGAPADETVPSLAGVLELLPAGKRCLIEVKRKETALEVLAAIRRAGVLEQTGVCSFMASELRILRVQEPGLPLILNLPRLGLFRLDRMIERAAREGFGGVFLFPRSANERLVRRAHQLGLEVHAGPVDTPEAAERLIDFGVDAIETNDPATIVSMLGALA
jgi:glycerophosphoryl diester phosphodiesterase